MAVCADKSFFAKYNKIPRETILHNFGLFLLEKTKLKPPKENDVD